MTRKPYPCDSPQACRERYLRYRAKKPMTPFRAKYGKLQVSKRFAAIAEQQGITVDAARMRYYRGQA